MTSSNIERVPWALGKLVGATIVLVLICTGHPVLGGLYLAWWFAESRGWL